VETRASDIHLEPFENEFRCGTHRPGFLPQCESAPKPLNAIVSRVKIMGKMDIAEHVSRDGRIKSSAGQEIDVRGSTLPTIYGESW